MYNRGARLYRGALEGISLFDGVRKRGREMRNSFFFSFPLYGKTNGRGCVRVGERCWGCGESARGRGWVIGAGWFLEWGFILLGCPGVTGVRCNRSREILRFWMTGAVCLYDLDDIWGKDVEV